MAPVVVRRADMSSSGVRVSQTTGNRASHPTKLRESGSFDGDDTISRQQVGIDMLQGSDADNPCS